MVGIPLEVEIVGFTSASGRASKSMLSHEGGDRGTVGECGGEVGKEEMKGVV